MVKQQKVAVLSGWFQVVLKTVILSITPLINQAEQYILMGLKGILKSTQHSLTTRQIMVEQYTSTVESAMLQSTEFIKAMLLKEVVVQYLYVETP